MFVRRPLFANGAVPMSASDEAAAHAIAQVLLSVVFPSSKCLTDVQLRLYSLSPVTSSHRQCRLGMNCS